MAVDKKSQHVGNHGGRYTDNDGQTKQFTYIDHDIKPKMSNYIPEGNIKETVKSDRNNLIERILLIPAVFASDIHIDYTIRGEAVKNVEWNDKMLYDEGVDITRLYDIYTLSSKREDFHKKGITI